MSTQESVDGNVTIDELHDYVYEQVVQKTHKQTPVKSSHNEQRGIVIARNLNPVRPAGLPPGVRHALESEIFQERQSAVIELAKLLEGRHLGLALAVQQALENMAQHDDSRRISNLAHEKLQAYHEMMSSAQLPAIDQPGMEREPASRGAKAGQPVIEIERTPVTDGSQGRIEEERRLEEEEEQRKAEVTAQDISHRSATEAINSSGQGKDAIVPEEIKKWNWGAFLLSGFWGLGNGTYIGLLSFVPFTWIMLDISFWILLIPVFVISVILGFKGNEWAWRNKRWESVEHFQRVQRKWTQVGVLAIIAAAIPLVLLVPHSIRVPL
jgi:hypothetical protein